MHLFFFFLQKRAQPVFFAAAGLLATACTAPRSITTSGKVTPKGEFRVSYNQGLNVSTEAISRTTSAVKDFAKQANNAGTVEYSQAVVNVQTAALAYLLDPFQATADLGIRYGIVPRLDAGYKYTFGSHVFDAQYQLLGPTGSIQRPGEGAKSGTTYASVGLQFASQRAKLPNIPFLEETDALLNFNASRRDLLVPLTFSHSFGPEEETGAISYGLAYGHTWVSYGFAPDNIYTGGRQLPALPTQQQSFSSFGAFANLKIGFRYLYFVPALSVFYQNYGDYTLLNGENVSLSGLTFVPSLGLQARIPTKR